MSASSPIDLFNALVDSAAWPSLRIGLHILFLLTVGYILKLMVDFRDLTALRHRSRPARKSRIFVLGLVLLFASVLLYQATWQLTGVTRPEFVAFMQSHDRRQFNPAHRIRRGRIVDRHGEVLAYSQEYRGQVYRRYPYGPVFAHVVGYSDPKFGTSGMEAAANAHLNGSSPANLAAWGELGRQLLTRDKRPRGQDLVLTLDAQLQLMAAKLLGKHRGAVVLLRPDNGAVRVLASAPSYDPNQIAPSLFRGGGSATPLLNRATQGLYPPGSTFKIVLAAQALNAGFKGRIHCPADGYTTSSRYRKIRDHEYYSAQRNGGTWKGHGDLDLATALAESSNVFFAKLGVGYGHDAFYENTERFLFNRQIRLHESPYGAQGMSTGRVPRIAASDQYGLAQMSIGQGRLLVTPAQMALIAASVANRGLAMKPRLVEGEPSSALSRLMSTSSAGRLAGMMRKAIMDGTGRGIDVDTFSIAGKTGTAQNPQGKAHSWFVGFAPAERPALAVAVLVEHGGYGAKTAAPIARDLLVRASELGMLH